MGQNLTGRVNDYNVDSQFEEFRWYTSGEPFTSVIVNSSTVAAAATPGTKGEASSILLTTGTTTGNYTGVKSTNTNFLFQNVPMYFGCRYTFSSTSTNDQGIFAGFSSTATTLGMTASAAPGSTGTGAFIYKLPANGAYWGVQANVNGTTTNSTVSNVLATDGTHLLEVCVNYWDQNNVMITYLVDGIQLTYNPNPSLNSGFPIQHKVPTANAAAMYACVFDQTPQNGAELAYVDFISTSYRRI